MSSKRGGAGLKQGTLDGYFRKLPAPDAEVAPMSPPPVPMELSQDSDKTEIDPDACDGNPMVDPDTCDADAMEVDAAAGPSSPSAHLNISFYGAACVPGVEAESQETYISEADAADVAPDSDQGEDEWVQASQSGPDRRPHTLPRTDRDTAWPPLRKGPTHTVLFAEDDIRNGVEGRTSPPRPSPQKLEDRWDRNCVRMPHSRWNAPPNGNARWPLIENALMGLMTREVRVGDIADSIRSYSAQGNRWNFDALEYFLQSLCDENERSLYLARVIPSMARLALRLPELCTAPIPMLRSGSSRSVSMTQEQAACLLAHAFFCTFPRRNPAPRNPNAEGATYPPINFNGMFASDASRPDRFPAGAPLEPCAPKTAGKLRCIFHYFLRVTESMPVGTLTFHRRSVAPQSVPKWSTQDAELCDLDVRVTGTIEDDGDCIVQADFANCFLGGGALSKGCVQEEIRFMICPELIVGMLFCEQLDDLECVMSVGAERFSDYTGYAQTFTFKGDHVDDTPRDKYGRRMTSLVAIDALIFRGDRSMQFTPDKINRELNKAWVGFHRGPGDIVGIATGNWGCGAFGGDRELKAVIQILAASIASRPLLYFTFGDEVLAQHLTNFHYELRRTHTRIGALYRAVLAYGRFRAQSPPGEGPGLFASVLSMLSGQ